MLQRLLLGAFNFMTREVYREFREGCDDPAGAQRGRLRSILARNAGTEFGLKHSFASIKSIEEYRAAVPVRRFADFEPYIERMCRGEQNILTADAPEMFATTSGTTDKPKFIPVTPSFYSEFYGTQKVWSRLNLNEHPSITRGKFLTIVSPWDEGRTAGGTPYGAISGRNYLNHSTIPVQRCFLAIPYSVFCVKDYEAKYYAILRLAVQSDISLISILNPSTIVLLAEKMKEYAPDLIKDLRDGGIKVASELPPEVMPEIRGRLKPDVARSRELESLLQAGQLQPRRVWPGSRLVTTWTGGASAFYLKRFAELFGDVPLRDFGYTALEGYFSIPFRSTTTARPEDFGGLFAAAGHFVEFAPYPDGNGEPVLCDGLERGRLYRVIITASNGLYRYDIGDVVEVLGFEGKMPLIAFRYRADGVVSVTGEKVTEHQAALAFRGVCEKTGLVAEDFVVGVEWGEKPMYVFAVEGTQEGCPDAASKIAKTGDEELKRVNVEYRAKRESGRLGPAKAILLRKGSMAAYRKARLEGGAHDAQSKMPHLVNDCSFFEKFDVIDRSEPVVFTNFGRDRDA